MLNQNLSIFKKGNFEGIDDNFISEGTEVLRAVKTVQEKYHKNDTDTFINELRDSIVGHHLGFDLVNTNKHGFDCKDTQSGNLLEVKDASFNVSDWTATFNDTTLEKAAAFKDKKVFLALAVWEGASDLLFICYGQNSAIGNFLEQKVNWFKTGHTVRSTQSISFTTLINTYGFNVLAIGKSKAEILEILKNKNKSLANLDPDRIIDQKDFHGVES